MALTGRSDGPALGPPEPLVGQLEAWGRMLCSDSGAVGRRVAVDPLHLLVERAAIAGLHRRGATSCGGATRLLRAGDGWIAVALARPEDVEAVPAWLQRDGLAAAEDVWDVVERSVARRPTDALIADAGRLGLPVAALPAAPPVVAAGDGPFAPLPVRAVRLGSAPARDLSASTVIDVSALWAGPLCGRLLAEAGARVAKVESASRPDGARRGPAAFFDLLNAGKESVALDLTSAGGAAQLAAVVGLADVVIEASRPTRVAPARARRGAARGVGQPASVGLDHRLRPRGGGGRPGRLRRRQRRRRRTRGLGRLRRVRAVLLRRRRRRPGDRAGGGRGGRACPGLGRTLARRHRPAGRCREPRRPNPPRRRPPGHAAAGALLTRRRPPARSGHRGSADGGSTATMTEAPALHLHDVEVRGRVVDVLVTGGRITAVGPDLRSSPGARAVDGGGGAVLPGLHDHHLHLAAMAARVGSVRVGPPAVRTREELGRALAEAHASRPPVPGSAASTTTSRSPATSTVTTWTPSCPRGRCASSTAPARCGCSTAARWTPSRPAAPTIRGSNATTRADRPAASTAPTPGSAIAGRRHHSTSRPSGGSSRLTVSPASPTPPRPPTSPTGTCWLAPAHARRSAGRHPGHRRPGTCRPLPSLAAPPRPRQAHRRGPPAPALDQLVADTRTAHGADRAVAVHCVTHVALVLALAALDEAGVRPGDRIEHAAVADPDLAASLARRGLVVVTQPGFVAARGDEYLAEVEAADRPHLYPCRSLLDAGVAVGGSTDRALHRPRSMARGAGGRRPPHCAPARSSALPRRSTRSVPSACSSPGSTILEDHAARSAPGTPADLCLLDRPLARQLADPDASAVRLTIHAGHITHEA